MKFKIVIVAFLGAAILSGCQMSSDTRTVVGVAGGAAAGLITAEVLGAMTTGDSSLHLQVPRLER